MNIQKKQRAAQEEIIANLCAIGKHPCEWLPHTVYVEEEGEDEQHFGIPVYTRYRLEEIRQDGTCTLFNPISMERFTSRYLHEINVDWLVTVWERYLELCLGQDLWKENARTFLRAHTTKSDEEISTFLDTSWDKTSAYTDNLKQMLGDGRDTETWIIVYPIDSFERDADIREIMDDYENNPCSEVEKLAPLDFTTLINDDMFNDQDFWVRAVQLPMMGEIDTTYKSDGI